MEDVLVVYMRPHDPDRVLVCLDETSKQLIAERSDEFAPSKANAHLPLPRARELYGGRIAQACGGCQICCTAESRPPPPTGLWQRWVISPRT
jgi:hypothetical protein